MGRHLAPDAPQKVASTVLAGLGPALLRARTAADRLAVCRGALAARWIDSVPLPVADAKAVNQTVALIDGCDFQRTTSAEDAARGYQELPRTRVYESVDVRSDSWVSLVSLHITALLRRRVVATLYASQAGDRNLGAHDDQWLGIVVQMQGVKQWTVWKTQAAEPADVVIRAGDVLILPKGMTHEVATPSRPGSSVHLLLAVTDEPIPPCPNDRQLVADTP